jgi:hypothetical protein
MKRITLSLLLVVTLLLGLGWAHNATQAQGLDCANLNEADCTQFTNVVQNFRATTFQVRDLTYSAVGTLALAFPLSEGPIVLDEEGRISAMDLTTETGSRFLYSENTLYTQLSPEQEVWEANQGGDQLTDFMTTVLDVIRNSAPTRLDDQDLEGQTLAVYQIQASAADLLELPDLAQLAQGIVSGLPNNMEAELPFVGDVLSEDSFSVQVWVGADNQIYRISAQVAASLDASAISADLPAVALDASFDSLLEGHGQVVEITAPENFVLSAEPIFSLDTSLSEIVNLANPNLDDRPIAYGDTLAGEVDSNVNDTVDNWAFTGAAGDVVTITVKSAEDSLLDAYIVLANQEGVLVFNDDQDGSNSAIAFYDPQVTRFELPADGDYLISVSGAGEFFFGTYDLTLSKE